jgi:hypothetical protein
MPPPERSMMNINYSNKNQIPQMMIKGGPQVRTTLPQSIPPGYPQGGMPPPNYIQGTGGVQQNMMIPQHLMPHNSIPPHMINNVNPNFNMQNRRSMEMMGNASNLAAGNNMQTGKKMGEFFFVFIEKTKG